MARRRYLASSRLGINKEVNKEASPCNYTRSALISARQFFIRLGLTKAAMVRSDHY